LVVFHDHPTAHDRDTLSLHHVCQLRDAHAVVQLRVPKIEPVVLTVEVVVGVEYEKQVGAG
jgi:hypothetical protein